MSALVVRGDARALPLPTASVDAVVTDPPYLLSFMGRDWDSRPAHEHLAWHLAWAREALRVLKPGGHLLAFGGTRTYHRLTCAIEDAGLEIRDSIGCLTWCYAEGFPKSRNVSADIDAMAGAVPVVVAEGAPVRRMIPGADQNRTGSWIKDNGREYVPVETEPATEDAARWQGWGTALKPAWEPIVVARKPLAGTVAANVLAYGTGAVNVDACRVGTTREVPASHSRSASAIGAVGISGKRLPSELDPNIGRWPTNLVLVHHPDCADRCEPGCHVAELDAQSGTTSSAAPSERTGLGGRSAGIMGRAIERTGPRIGHSDSGGASRYYPTFRFNPKADTWERPEVALADGTVLRHPTVKPVDLMRWLVKMVTPPGGLVLDPFAGSGATLQAATVEGFRAVGVEMDAGHCALIAERLSWPVRIDRDGKFERIRAEPVLEGQGSLLDMLSEGEPA